MTLIPNSKPRCVGRLIAFLWAVLLPAYLTGCATSLTAPSQALKVYPEASCLAPAEQLPQLTDPTIPGLVQLLVDVADSYHILAARHKCLAEFTRR